METNGASNRNIKFPVWVVQLVIWALLGLLSTIATYTNIRINSLEREFRDLKEDNLIRHSAMESKQLLMEYRQNEMRKLSDDFIMRLQEWDRDIRGYPPAATKRRVERPNRQNE